MTPEMYAELQGQGQAPEPQTPPQQQEVQSQAQPQPEAGVPPKDDVAQAKELLGISQTEDMVTKMQEQMNEMKTEKIRESMTAKYPDIPYEIVQKEIDKVASINPQFAEAMKTTEDGMEMAYRSAQALIKPQEKPDNLTDDESGGGQGENLDEMIMKGEADDFNLGKFIIGQ